jgi:hypothetical protein
MSRGAAHAQQRIKQHEDQPTHVNWASQATDQQKAELKALKNGTTTVSERTTAMEAVRQQYISFYRDNRIVDSEENAWEFVRRHHKERCLSGAEQGLESVFDFWVSYRFDGMESAKRNVPFIERSEQEQSYVYQFIMGEHGRKVCTIKPTHTSQVTHQVDGLFLIVNPDKLDDLVKIMRFDIEKISNDKWRYQLPYQVIESISKPEDPVYAFAVISDRARDIDGIEEPWEETLKLFGGDHNIVYHTKEYNRWKLSSLFPVDYKTLQQEIIPLFVYYLNARIPKEGGWKDSVSCAIVPPNFSPSIVSGEVFYSDMHDKWVEFEEEILNSLVVMRNGRKSRSFTRPTKQLREMHNKSSFFPFLKKVKKGNKEWCDGDVETWGVYNPSSPFIQQELQPLVRAQQAEWEDINVVGVRRYTILYNANVEIFVQGIGSECETCQKTCHIRIEAANKVVTEADRERERAGGELVVQAPTRREKFLWRCRECNKNTRLRRGGGKDAQVWDGLDEGPFLDLARELTELLVNPDVDRQKKEEEERKRRDDAEERERERERVEAENARLARKRKLKVKAAKKLTEEEEREKKKQALRLTEDEINAMFKETVVYA